MSVGQTTQPRFTGCPSVYSSIWCIAAPDEAELPIPNSIHEQEVIHLEPAYAPRKVQPDHGTAKIGMLINWMSGPPDRLDPTLMRIQFV